MTHLFYLASIGLVKQYVKLFPRRKLLRPVDTS